MKDYGDSYEQLIEVLNSITWYNCIYEPLLELKQDLVNLSNSGTYTKTNKSLEYKHDRFDDEQFEIFWMMLVLMYGEYGSSPRSGWLYLKYKEEIIEFIDKITKYGREEEGE